ncbi:hypothetical protein B7C62_18460 [Kitasatospora albolonga]|uniref:Uncharacterized protein n=1 Tax=Kitasatospora albolonga TaxID=68173 RepID=A0ABC8BW33_9ACTN|nr:hypothetical protein B7C62_18460 [Kitasatospora albolonga]
MSASTARHETRALLRAHLAAASGFGHLTRHCPICHRLLRLAMEPGESGESRESGESDRDAGSPAAPSRRAGSPAGPPSAAAPPDGGEDERPAAT